jgi:hypothetical protein
MIEFMKKTDAFPNNYVKAVARHYEAGQEMPLPFLFIVQFNDRIMGAAELARRELEAVVIPWIKSRERDNGENLGRGYRPSVMLSVFNRLDPRLHEGFNLPVVGE